MLYASTIFLSAFLLFQIQPLIAKLILPWFGGSSAVWTTCMLFFQLLLLAGYLYSHLTNRLSPRAQALVHAALLAVAVVSLPILPREAWRPAGDEEPVGRILVLLASSVGVQYFLLATTTPLVQSWYFRERQGAMPYRLFALSNLGSMLALLTYPVAVEPWLPNRVQAWTWSAMFALFAILVGAIGWRGRHLVREPEHVVAGAPPPPGAADAALWIALPACASILLLAVTSHLSQNVAPMPFLWVLPLALYLLSFIVCFGSSRWYQRPAFLPPAGLALVGMSLTLFPDYHNQPLWITLPLHAGGLFLACMACHGELARRKPHPRHLTVYYLMISVGGALGGVFVSLAAPKLFNDLHELPIGIVATAAVLAWALARERTTAARTAAGFTLALSAGLAVGLIHAHAEQTKDVRRTVRNFYAALHVADSGSGADAMRELTHGTITHGKQFLDPGKQAWPTTYYGPKSGVGAAIAARRAAGSPIRIGVVGLGVGTLAAYGESGDVVRIYELNPQVIMLAQSEFTFLSASKATIELELGDARLSLEREPAQRFDVLAIDAFSSDSIPAHLLTREAFAVYFRHMKPGGILAVHISNRYIDLQPVLAEAVRAFDKHARLVDTDDIDALGILGATWVLVADSEDELANEAIASISEPLAPERSVRLWTDDFSDVYRLLK